MQQTSSLPRVGILGGGQLARMLLQAAPRLGLAPHVLATARHDPAARIGGEISLGRLDDEAALRSFFSTCDIVGFESEFHPAERLARAAEGLELEFVPSLQALGVTQDKLQQKALLVRVGAASAPYCVLEPSEGDWRSWLEECFERLGERLVLKWSRLGYDGKGTLFVDKGEGTQHIPSFLEAAKERGAEVYAETRIPFVRELALVATHGLDGQLACYPLVISEQERGICKRVYGAAMDFGVDATLQTEAERYAAAIATMLPLHGTFALELFETEEGELLVNEMAPRVHNSGHYTLDASECSQFENHLRAISGIALNEPRTRRIFGMLNLISNVTLPAPPPPEVEAPFVLHWYDKAEARPGRKMAHINVVADSATELRARLDELRALDARWLESLAAAAKENDT